MQVAGDAAGEEQDALHALLRSDRSELRAFSAQRRADLRVEAAVHVAQRFALPLALPPRASKEFRHAHPVKLPLPPRGYLLHAAVEQSDGEFLHVTAWLRSDGGRAAAPCEAPRGSVDLDGELPRVEERELGGADGGDGAGLELERDEGGVVEEVGREGGGETRHEAVGLLPRDKPEKLVGGERELRGAVGNAEESGAGRRGVGRGEAGVVGEVGEADGEQVAEDVAMEQFADLMGRGAEPARSAPCRSSRRGWRRGRRGGARRRRGRARRLRLR